MSRPESIFACFESLASDRQTPCSTAQIPREETNRTCHVLSQQQRIDWLTVKVEPVVEADLGRVRAEYSRPMRFFSQDDQLLLANYGDFHIYDFGIEPYAVVPDGFSQADRLKLAVDVGGCTDFYANSYIRDTHNKFRDTHRKSYGFDMRLTNRSYDGVKLTAYATLNNQTNQSVPFFLPQEEAALAVKTALIPPYGIRHPIDYFRRTVGAEVKWHPFRGYHALRRLAITGGLKQGRIEREFAAYVVQIPEEPPGPVYDQDLTDYFSGKRRHILPVVFLPGFVCALQIPGDERPALRREFEHRLHKYKFARSGRPH